MIDPHIGGHARLASGWTSSPAQADDGPGEDALLEAAHSIGRRLLAQAIWRGDRCTWLVSVPEGPPFRRTVKRQEAGGALYSGTAGIGLFLGELARVTADPTFEAAAVAALRWALDWARAQEGRIGLYSGVGGVALVALRLGLGLDHSAFVTDARCVVEAMAAADLSGEGTDIIGGTAGAICALLNSSRSIPDAVDVAERLGRTLVARASPQPVGLSWAVMPSSCVREACGLAHGASGIAAALLELWSATGNADFRYAGEQAFAYERLWFDKARGSPPDARDNELGEILAGDPDAARQLLRAGRAPYRPSFFTSWCWGAPGSALARLCAYRLTGRPLYLEEAEHGVRATAEDGLDLPNASLCHGIAGSCDVLLETDARSHEAALARATLVQAVARFEAAGKPWPSGSLGALPDPSFMLGDAGIGYTLLRACDPGLPTMLWLSSVAPRAPEPDATSCALSVRHAQALFPRATAVLSQVAPSEIGNVLAERETLHFSSTRTPRLETRILGMRRQLAPDQARRLEEALQLDRARLAVTARITNLLDERVDSLLRREPALEPGELVALDRCAELAWMDGKLASEPPHPAQLAFLLFRRHNEVQVQPVRPFAAALLEAIRTPITVAALADQMRALFPDQTMIDEERLRQSVIAQLLEAWKLGAVRAASDGTWWPDRLYEGDHRTW